jgi:hypothetical protein
MKTRMISTLIAPGILLALFASNALGQVQRTFVSGLGSDGNPCSRAAPCRTLTQAVLQTNPGGEVIVLDSAGYGPFQITRSVSIIASPGAYAGISVFSGDGIDINAGAVDTVILRGLTINNQGSNGSGIFFSAGGILHIESCVVNGFASGSGVEFAGPANLEVKDSIIRGNGTGIRVSGSTGGSDAAIDNVRLEGNISGGLDALDGSRVTVRNSVASKNGNGFHVSASGGGVTLDLQSCIASNNRFNGISAIGSGSGTAAVNVESCTASANTVGIAGQTDLPPGVTTIRVSNSMVTNNSLFGLVNNGTLLLSRGNNTVEGNGTNTIGPIGSYTAR